MKNLTTKGESRIMNKFAEISCTELQEIDGGIVGTLGVIIAGYALLREVVRDQGRSDGREMREMQKMPKIEIV